MLHRQYFPFCSQTRTPQADEDILRWQMQYYCSEKGNRVQWPTHAGAMAIACWCVGQRNGMHRATHHGGKSGEIWQGKRSLLTWRGKQASLRWLFESIICYISAADIPYRCGRRSRPLRCRDDDGSMTRCVLRA